MDLGIFRRRKTTFWAWIALPGISVIVAGYALNVYCMSVEDRVQQRKAVLGILGAVEERMVVARDVVNGFELIASGPTTAAEDISTRITELARRHRFTINSLRVKDSRSKKDDVSSALVMEIKGEGNLLSMMEFLNELQSPQYLTVIDAATMQMLRQGGSEAMTYTTELTVRCFWDALEGGR